MSTALDPRAVLREIGGNDEERRFALEQLVESELYASKVAPQATVVALHATWFRLSVGLVESFTAYRDAVRLMLLADALDPRLDSEYLHRYPEGQPYTSVRANQAVLIAPYRDFGELRHLVRSSHLAWLDAAARTTSGQARQRSPHSQHHRPDFLTLVQAWLATPSDRQGPTPRDDIEGILYREGTLTKRVVVYRDRSKSVRDHRLDAGPLRCAVCCFDPGRLYGEAFARMLDVHHLKPLASGEAITDPVRDCVILCPTCHRMAHHGVPDTNPRTIHEMRAILRATSVSKGATGLR